MNDVNVVNNSMFNHRKLSKDKKGKIQNPSLHMSIVGPLQYVTLTRTYIFYCVNKACQFMTNPLGKIPK